MSKSKITNGRQRKVVAFALIIMLVVVGVVPPITSMAGSAESYTAQNESLNSEQLESASGDAIDVAPEEDSDSVVTVDPKPASDNNNEAPAEQKQSSKKSDGKTSTQADEKYDLTATWGTSGPATTVIDDGKTKNLVIKIDGSGQTQASTNHKLVISYAHVDTADYTEQNGETGIQVADYDKPDANDSTNPLNGVVTDIKNDTKNRQLIYTFSEQAFVQIGINVTFVAKDSKAYLGEKLDIETKFYKDDKLSSDIVKSQAEANMNTGYARIYPSFLNPNVFSTGAGSGNLWMYLNTFNLNVHGRYATVTYDFSKAIITAKGETKAYIEWLEEYKNSGKPIPFRIKSHDGSELDNNNEGYPTIITLTPSTLQTAADYKVLTYEKTDEFVSSGRAVAQLDLRQIDADIKFYQNNRGPEFSMAKANDATDAAELIKTTNFAYYNTDVILSAKDADAISYNFYASSGQPYIQPNSVKYKDKSAEEYGFLYQQTFFKLGAYTARTTQTAIGKEETVKVTLPEGVNITRIRLPKVVTGTHEYKSVVYKGKEYFPDSYIELDEPIKREFELKIKELVKLTASYYQNEDMLTFLGTTDSMNEGDAVKFTLVGTGDPITRQINTKILNDKGNNFSIFVNKGTFIGEKNSQNAIIAIQKTNPTKGTSIYMSSQVLAHTYAYGSVWTLDPSKICTKDVIPISPNPVVLFNVPPGMEVGDVEITGKKISEINGKEITAYYIKEHQNKGKWGSEGGSLVEVKLAGPNGEDVFINNTATNVNLELKIPVDYDKGLVKFERDDIGVGTWYENSKSLTASPSQGYLYNIALPESATTMDKTKYIVCATGSTAGYYQDIDPSIPIGATIQGSVRLSDGKTFMPYSPNKPASVPVRPAGSDNEQFKLNVIYNIDKNVSNGRVYFLMPQNTGWRPTLTGMPQIKTNVDSGKYNIYYTDVDARNKTMDASGDINVAWTKLTSTTTTAELEGVKGFKIEFSELNNGNNFTMLMPYRIPKLQGAVDWTDDAQIKAIGQTQYYLGGSVKADNAATAALKLTKSDVPEIKAVNDAGKEAEMPGTTQNFKYKDTTTSLPAWHKAITYDDFTAGVKLDSVKVEYTKQGGNDKTTTTFGMSKIDTTAYQPASKGSIEYKSGYINEINFGTGSSEDVISLDKPGEYKITYTTTDDDDNQISTFTRTIKVEKGGLDTIDVASKSTSMFHDQSLADVSTENTWDKLFRSNMTITDDGISINPNSSSVTLRSITNLTDSSDTVANGDIEKIVSDHGPGRYEVVYTYDDGFGSSTMIRQTFTVKFRTAITVNVKSTAGSNISDAAMSFNSGANVITGSTGSKVFNIEATDLDPVNASYNVELKSVPTGYTLPSTKVLSGKVTKVTAGVPIAFSVPPVKIKGILEGNDTKDIVKTISLYDEGGTLVAGPANVKGLASYTFDPADVAGIDIFSGKYYMQLELNPGYNTASGSDFAVKNVSDDSVLVNQEFSIANADIEKTAKFDAATQTVNYYMNAGSDKSLYTSDKAVAHRGYAKAPTTDPKYTGYIFDGWSKNEVSPYNKGDEPAKWNFGSDRVTSTTNLYACWLKYDYAVNFDGNTGTVEGQNAKTVQVASPNTTLGNSMPADAVKTNYTFKGWNKDKGATSGNFTSKSAVVEPITVFAIFAPNTYKVSFDTQGATSQKPDDAVFTAPSLTVNAIPATPIKDGYKFEGWFTSPGGVGTKYESGFKVEKDQTVYAKWQIKKYNVTYMKNDGTNGVHITQQAITHGSFTTKPSNDPTRKGYIFDGWLKTKKDAATSFADSDKWNFATDKVNSDVTVYAAWKKYSYTVAFDVNTGTTPQAITSETINSPSTTLKEAGKTMPSDPQKSHHKFMGWSSQKNSAVPFDEDTVITSNTTAYALWSANEYTVKFNTNGADSNTPASVTFSGIDRTVPAGKVPADPTRTGYGFGGWFFDDGTWQSEYKAGTEIIGNATVYAKWTQNKYDVKYYKNAGSDNELLKTESQIIHGSKTVAPTDPEYTGYIFDGWSTTKHAPYDTAPNDKWDFNSGVTANTTLHACWLKYDYKVTFNGNNGNVEGSPTKEVSVKSPATTVGTDMPSNSDVVRNHYTFAGWSLNQNGPIINFTSITNIIGDVTLYAQWTPNTYNVKFDAQSGSPTPNNQSFTAPNLKVSSLPGEPSRTGYAFMGWYTGQNGTGTKYDIGYEVSESQTVYASWKIKSYKLSFDANGGSKEPNAQTIKYGGKASKVNNPSRDGYSFDGWFTSRSGGSKWSATSFTMPAKNVTVYAHWTAEPVNPPVTPPVNPPTDPPTVTPDPPQEVAPETSNPSTLNVDYEPTGTTDTGNGTGLGSTDQTSGNKTFVDPSIPSMDIGDNSIPLYGTDDFDSWSLLNILFVILGLVLAGIIAIRARAEKYKMEVKPLWAIIMAGLMIVNIIILIVVSDFVGVMTVFDKSTIIFALISAVEVFAALKAFRPTLADNAGMTDFTK